MRYINLRLLTYLLTYLAGLPAVYALTQQLELTNGEDNVLSNAAYHWARKLVITRWEVPLSEFMLWNDHIQNVNK